MLAPTSTVRTEPDWLVRVPISSQRMSWSPGGNTPRIMETTGRLSHDLAQRLSHYGDIFKVRWSNVEIAISRTEYRTE